MSKHVADPSPRSPGDVRTDRRYRDVVYDLGWGPHAGHRVYIVVFHAGTETYWEAIYDLANADQPTSWAQVVPKSVQRIEYQRI